MSLEHIHPGLALTRVDMFAKSQEIVYRSRVDGYSGSIGAVRLVGGYSTRNTYLDLVNIADRMIEFYGPSLLQAKLVPCS